MATFRSNVAGAYDVARSGTGTITVPFEYAIVANTSFAAIDDVLVLAKIPKYATILSFCIDMPDCGTSGACDLGTSILRTAFASAVTIVTSAKWTSDSLTYASQGALPYKILDTDSGDVTVDADFRLTATAALSAWAAVTIKGWVQYVCNETAALAETAVAVP